MRNREDPRVIRLAGQGAKAAAPPERSGLDDGGYIMVVLLIGMAITAIWMSAALPAWRQQAQRQREEDLIFRGEQYARAIVTYQKKNQGALPPNIDILVSQRYLRKKWKDPITNQDFVPVGAGMAPGLVPGGTPQRGAQAPMPTLPGPNPAPGRGAPGGPQQTAQANQPPGVSGVRSASTATSIKIYRNQQQHSLWEFDARHFYTVMSYNPNPQRGQPGAPGRGDGRGDGRGAPVGGRPAGVGDGRGLPGGPPPPPPPPGGRGRDGGPGAPPGRGRGD
jgi:type II secretory pathway pseudopilin PulG